MYGANFRHMATSFDILSCDASYLWMGIILFDTQLSEMYLIISLICFSNLQSEGV
jgi:hypothetical protein